MCVHGCVSICFGMEIKVGAYRKRKGSSGKEGKGGGIQSQYGQKHNIFDQGPPCSPLLYAMNINFVK